MTVTKQCRNLIKSVKRLIEPTNPKLAEEIILELEERIELEKSI